MNPSECRLAAASLMAMLVGCAPARPTRSASGSDGWISAPREEDRAVRGAVEPLPVEQCGSTADGFDRWVEGFRRHARSQGISSATVASALETVAYDPGVIEQDRAQRPFKLTFEEFVARRMTPARIARGRRVLGENRELLARIVTTYGVPAEVLVSLWGLETDYGANMGRTSALSALATLAWDCRRAGRFRGELLAALKIVERGDLTPREMRGAWAGELGQTQFLPSSYVEFGVDFDGDGRIDLLESSADALASTARFLQGHGWKPGLAYGPGSPNDAALAAWNASEMYRRTIVLFAGKLLAGSPR